MRGELAEVGQSAEIAPPAHYKGNSQDYLGMIDEHGQFDMAPIGTITTLKDHRYTLVFDSQLNVANPKITVRQPPSEPIDLGAVYELF